MRWGRHAEIFQRRPLGSEVLLISRAASVADLDRLHGTENELRVSALRSQCGNLVGLNGVAVPACGYGIFDLATRLGSLSGAYLVTVPAPPGLWIRVDLGCDSGT